MRRGLAWTGDIDASLLLYLSGRGHGSLSGDALADPIGWALRTLGIDLASGLPERATVQRSFRQSLIDAHPDHGGDDADAARRIADITEARRILLAS